MGYENLERQSLITLEKALSVFSTQNSLIGQLRNEVSYELGRIRKELEKYN